MCIGYIVLVSLKLLFIRANFSVTSYHGLFDIQRLPISQHRVNSYLLNLTSAATTMHQVCLTVPCIDVGVENRYNVTGGRS